MKPYKGYTAAQRMASLPLLDKLKAEGKVPPLKVCSACGQTEGKLQYHNDDYAPETFIENTRVLCYSCHMVHHIYHNNPNNMGARLYIQFIRSGRKFKPNNGNFGKLTAGLSWLNKNQEHIDEIENL